MKIIRTILPIVLCFLTAVSFASANGKTVLTIDEAVRIALDNNPKITVSDNEIEIRKADLKSARSQYYPQISSRVVVPFIESESGFFLDQIIWDFGQTSSRVKSSKAMLESSKYDKKTTEDDLILEVKTNYYAVLAHQHLVEACRKKVKEYEKRTERAQEFFKYGKISQNDLTKAEVSLENTKLELISTQNNLEISKINLLTVMGVKSDFNYRLTDSESITPILIEIDDAMEQAISNHPEIKSLKAKEASMRANLKAAKREFYPLIVGRAAYRFEGEGAETPGLIAGVGIKFPLFKGFSRFAELEKAKGNIGRVKAELESAKADITAEIKKIHLDLKFAEQKIISTKKAKISAETSLLLAKERYRLKRASEVELAEAEQLYASTNASYKQSIYNYNVIGARLSLSLGEPNESYK